MKVGSASSVDLRRPQEDCNCGLWSGVQAQLAILLVRFAFCSLVLLAFSCLALIVLTAGRQARAKNPLDIFPRRGYLAAILVVVRGAFLLRQSGFVPGRV